MPSSDDHPEYDANLLSTAPAPTKGMVQVRNSQNSLQRVHNFSSQSGYATDLLEDKSQPSRRDDPESSRHKSLSRHTYVPNRKSFADAPQDTEVIRTKHSQSTEKTPFYRTKRGIIILVIVAIVLLAAIIGGAVGGSLANKKDTKLVPALKSVDTIGGAGSPVSSQGDVPSSVSQPPRGTTTVFVTPSSSLTPPSPDSILPSTFSLGARP